MEYLERILWEEFGSKEKYEKDYGDTPVTKLVHKIVGLDRQVAVKAFSESITAENLNYQQSKFVELIIEYIVKISIAVRSIYFTRWDYRCVQRPAAKSEKCTSDYRSN